MNHPANKKDHPPGQNKVFTIIINGREENHEGNTITFEQVIVIAFGAVSSNPNIVYTVTYSRGQGNKPQGTLVAGGSVKVKEGMIFNATETDKS